MRAGSGHQFGAGAADIDHQTLIGAAGGVGDPLINQTRFFFATNDLYRTAEDLLRFRQKFAGIDGKTQRGGGHDADLRRRNILQAFGKQA